MNANEMTMKQIRVANVLVELSNRVAGHITTLCDLKDHFLKQEMKPMQVRKAVQKCIAMADVDIHRFRAIEEKELIEKDDCIYQTFDKRHHKYLEYTMFFA